MHSSRKRDRLATFQELLEAQRAAAPPCPHCGGNCADRARDQQNALEAMRTHIRVLEAAWSLELDGAAKA
jgi:transposase